MRLALYKSYRNSAFLPTQLSCKRLAMWERDHPIRRPMNDLYPFPANLIADFADLFRAFVVPARGQSLCNEAFHREVRSIKTFMELESGKTITIGWETLSSILGGIRFGQPGRSVEISFRICQLSVEGPRNATNR